MQNKKKDFIAYKQAFESLRKVFDHLASIGDEIPDELQEEGISILLEVIQLAINVGQEQTATEAIETIKKLNNKTQNLGQLIFELESRIKATFK